MAWTIGQTLQGGQYTIEKELGWGSFSITYLAKDDSGNYLVIKTPDENLLNQLSPAERNSLESKLYDEALKLERCKHPYIVRVLKTFKEGQVFCLAMEYIQGDTLASLIQRVLPQKEALLYIRQVGEALIEVHRQGLLHRDVKPANIMVRASQYEAVLIGFDLAGEFDYPLTSRWRDEPFSPIELNSSKKERRAYTDVYSLAATLYYLLTGEAPISAIKRKHDNQPLVPPKEINPQISQRVNQAIIKGMMLEPEARPQTMQQWLDLLGLRRKISASWLPTSKEDWVKLGQMLGGILGTAAAIAGIISMMVEVGWWH